MKLRENGFEGLRMFNNRDYSRWRDKVRGKGRDKRDNRGKGKENNNRNNIRKIYGKADQMYRDMKETLKNSVRAGMMEDYRE